MKLYQIKTSAQKKALYDARSRESAKIAKLRQDALLRRGAPSLYWPLSRDIDSRLWPYAVACLEETLRLSDTAVSHYAKIVELPGCQKLKAIALEHQSDTRTWKDQVLKAYCARTAIPQLPGVLEAYSELERDQDFSYLMTEVAAFILQNFNRQIDIANKNYKVIPGPQSEQLIKAIIVRLIIDYAGYDAARLHRYQHPDIERIMAAKPKPATRREREIRQQITNVYKSEGLNLKADDTLLNGASQWYKCRVNPGSIETYLQELADLDLKEQEPRYPDQGRVSNDIAPYDKATGYPRRN